MRSRGRLHGARPNQMRSAIAPANEGDVDLHADQGTFGLSSCCLVTPNWRAPSGILASKWPTRFEISEQTEDLFSLRPKAGRRWKMEMRLRSAGHLSNLLGISTVWVVAAIAEGNRGGCGRVDPSPRKR